MNQNNMALGQRTDKVLNGMKMITSDVSGKQIEPSEHTFVRQQQYDCNKTAKNTETSSYLSIFMNSRSFSIPDNIIFSFYARIL